MSLPDAPPLYKQAFNLVLNITIYLVMIWGILNYINFKQPSNDIFNGAFAILLGIAAICFSFSDKIKDKYLSDRLLFAAERLVHGSLLVLIAVALRYVALSILGDKEIESSPLWLSIPIATTVILGGIAFSNGMIFAQKGLRILFDLLNDRMFRHKDWDN